MLKRLLGAALLLALFCSPAFAAGIQQEHWQYYKELPAEKTGFVLIGLDRQVLRHANRDLSDLRLLNSREEEVPYEIVRNTGRARTETYPVQIIDSAVKEQDYTSATLDLGETGLLHNSVHLDINKSKDYLRQVEIEGSRDNRNWKQLAEDRIYNISGGASKNSVTYGPASYRYIRVKIDCQDGAPLRVQGSEARMLPKEKSGSSRVISEKITSNTVDEGDNVLVLDAGAKGYRVDRINLQVEGQNYHREVQLYSSSNREDWARLGRGEIYHYSWTGYEASRNALDIGRDTGRYIKLVIENQDNPPLDIKGAQIYGEAPKILAELGASTHTLWYGNGNCPQPQYDLEKFAHLVDRENLPRVEPGGEKTNPGFTPEDNSSNRWLLNAATILLAVVTGLVILKNMSARKNREE